MVTVAGQSLRNGGDGNGDAGHEHVKDRFAPQHTGQEHGAAYAKAEQRHHLSQPGEPLLQRCQILFRTSCSMAEICPIWVRVPVAMTTASALPRRIAVPA